MQFACFQLPFFLPFIFLRANSEGMDGGELGLLYFVVPVAPGRSRLFSKVYATRPAFKRMASIFKALPWLRHIYNHTVAAQDIAILHRQGTNMASADFPGWKKGFYLPTGSDSGVAVLRKWLESTQGGEVQWGPDVDPSPSRSREPSLHRETLFDTFHQHTEHCPHCSGALRALRKGMRAVQVALVACAVSAAYHLGKGAALVSGPVLGVGLAALLLAGVRVALGGMEKAFLVSDWKHSANKKLVTA